MIKWRAVVTGVPIRTLSDEVFGATPVDCMHPHMKKKKERLSDAIIEKKSVEITSNTTYCSGLIYELLSTVA